MTVTVTHNKVSAVADSGDTTLVQPSDWNANHTISGLGTAASLDAGVPNGVATLDSGGKVPTSQIPQMGDLNYQGTWNASTNSPTLTSSTGTKGYYYVVNVAGTTNLDGITDWQVGDWAVFNGTAWQKIDNTDAVTSVNGYTGTVVLTYSDVGAANAPTNTNITSMTGVTGGISSPDYIQFDTTYATTLSAGQLGWNGNNNLGLGMYGGNVIQHIGEDTFFYVKASSAITKGQLCMFTGAVGSSGVLTAAPSNSIPYAEAIMGIAAEDIALNGFGLVQITGSIRGLDTSAFADGDVLYYDSAVTGGMTKTYPASGPIVIVAAVAKAGSGSSGILTARISFQTRVLASTGISVTQTNNSATVTNTGVTSAVAGTGISVSGSTGAVTITNTAPDQTVAISAGTGITVSGTYPNFTVANSGVTSIAGTSSQITASASTGGVTLALANPINVDTSGNAGTVTNGVYTTGSYANPTWITSLAGSKISGTIDGGTF